MESSLWLQKQILCYKASTKPMLSVFICPYNPPALEFLLDPSNIIVQFCLFKVLLKQIKLRASSLLCCSILTSFS